MALVVKSSPYKAGDNRDGVQSLGWEDPLQEGMATRFSILVENPMDRRAWQAAVHSVAKSQKGLKQRSTHMKDGGYQGLGARGTGEMLFKVQTRN